MSSRIRRDGDLPDARGDRDRPLRSRGIARHQVGQSSKDNPVDVAEAGFAAMMEGEADVVTGWTNKLETTIANVTPNEILAERTRKQYQPGSGKSVSK